MIYGYGAYGAYFFQPPLSFLITFSEFERIEEFAAIVDFLTNIQEASNIVAWIGGRYNASLGKHVWSQGGIEVDPDLYFMAPTIEGVEIELTMRHGCSASADGAVGWNFPESANSALCEKFP